MQENEQFSYYILISHISELTPWRHSSFRAKSAWLKKSFRCEFGFSSKYLEHYLCDRIKIFRMMFLHIDLQNIKNWLALHVPLKISSNIYCLRVIQLFNYLGYCSVTQVNTFTFLGYQWVLFFVSIRDEIITCQFNL